LFSSDRVSSVRQFITLSLVNRSPSPEHTTAAAAKPSELLVVMPVKDWVCARCTGTGVLLTMDDAGPLRMTCADLDHLVFLGCSPVVRPNVPRRSRATPLCGAAAG